MRYLGALAIALILSVVSHAQGSPYFVTYDHHMEEPGDLEIATQTTIGVQKNNLPTYWAPLLEFEYGATGWWTTALYLEGTSQRHDSTVFTGWRLENKFKPLNGNHVINPLLYFEFENINEASRIQKEIVGHAEPSDESISEQRREKEREIEGKLILSSNGHGWNIAENFIVEKNLSEDEGVEFGYAFAVSRPLATLASGKDCTFCRERFNAGVELYGGLGSTERFGFRDTAQYIAPTLAWNIGDNSTLMFSPAFGLTENSNRMLIRVGYKYEIEGFGRKVARMFGGQR